MKRRTKTILGSALILAVLSGVFWWGGNAPGLRGWTPQALEAEISAPTPVADRETPPPAQRPSAAEQSAQDKPVPAADEDGKSSQKDMNQTTGTDQYRTEPVPEGKPIPAEPEKAVVSDQAYTCTISVRCDTVGRHMDWLDPGKAEMLPRDGVILAPTTTTFYEGESVFNVLQREMKRNKIPMEFMNAPIYNSAYIEGIYNLYEFDCGELSGWTYRVNEWFPNYGCSRYALQDGDVIEWLYTCDLGEDVGGNNGWEGENT